MKSRITLKQVAQASGVHYSTVSRVMDPGRRGGVTHEIADRVLDVANRLGYRTNTLASSLRTRRTQVIGVVVPDISSLLFPPILLGIEAALLEKGYMMIVGNTGNDAAVHRKVVAGMIDRQVDGLILATATLHDPIVDEWIERGAPLVLINRTDETGRAPAVINDDLGGIAMAVRHVVGLGHKKIGHIAGPQSLSTGFTRHRGFKLAAAEQRIPSGPQYIVTAASFTREAGRNACLELLDRKLGITAMIAANDLLALGCYDALAERGLLCPDDISVTGYNDAPFVDMVMPPLTTVRIQQGQMGIVAARLLLAKIEDPESHCMDIVLRPALVVRKSTAAAPAGSKRVASSRKK